jgi:prolyl 4-hydroxylase
LVTGLVSRVECAAIIDMVRPRLAPAKVSAEHGRLLSSGRTAESSWLEHDAAPVVQTVCIRLAATVGLPLRLAEALQVARYGPGGEYRAHFDAYDLDTPRGKVNTEKRGQRLRTALVYLSDVEAGGETVFPRLGVAVKAVCGAALIFENCVPGSTLVHPGSLHAGKPLVSGEKWIANLWFRERPRA